MRSESICVSGVSEGAPASTLLRPSVQSPSLVCRGRAAAVFAGACGSARSGRGRAVRRLLVTLGERAVWAPVGATVDLAWEG